MNKVFRVIWSQATQSWVAVSELTKAHKKQSSSNSLKAALGAATVLLSINSAEAAVLIGATENDTTTATKINNQNSKVSSWGITIGGAISKAGEKSVHIGDASGSVGSRNVVIGTYASAGYDEHKPADNPEKTGAFNQSVAIGAGGAAGEGARAYGDQSIAIGSNTIARGNSSIAIGNDDVDKTGSTDTTYTDLNGKTKTGSIANAYNELTGQNLGVGQYQDTTSKEAAVAIGVKSVAGDISLALGTGANADRVNAVAIGTGATANRDNAVAIGGGSTTDAAATSELKTTVNGLTFNWAGGERTISGDVVSFGKEGYERQLKHVSPGKVSATSTDAINGSQLYGVLNHLTSDPVYLYGADDSSDDKVAGDDAAKKSADAKDKKIVARSMADSRLNLKGGATGELTDNNIGVKYEDEGTIRFKLAKALSGLTSAEFKDANNNVVNITPTGVSLKKPNATNANTVTLSQNGLNNGGNAITNVAGNLQGSKASTTAPTTNATAPNDVDGIKNNAATVGDVLQAGWNLQEKGVAKDFVKPYDTVNFIDGNGTSVAVETTNDGTTSTVKYSVNLGNGLDKTKDNKITVKPADKSLEVNKDGVKVKTDGTTITTDPTNGLKVVTGGIEAGTTPGTVKVTDGDEDKIATVDSVVDAVNKAAFTLKASAGGGTRNGNSTVNANGEPIKAGSTIEMIAGKNLDVKHDKNGKITFATVDNPSFDTVQVGNSEGPKFSATTEGNISVSDKEGTKPVKITNVKDGEISANSKDAINGSQFHKVANNTIKLAGQNGDDTATATETNAQNLNKQGGIKFTVKSSDGTLLDVAATGDTITLTPKTATLTADKNGVPQANTTDGKLVTADDLVKALTKMGWKATAGNDGTGTVDNATSELIKAGETVTFKAGDNLAVKQAGKDFIYSLQKELTGLTSAEFKGTDANAPTTKLTNAGVTITPATATGKKPVSLTENGLDNGGNPITNVAGNLDGAKTGTNAPTTSATKPTLGTAANEVNSNNAATVGDVLNAGWNLQEKGTAKDFVTAYDTVNFVDGDGTSVSVTTNTDGKTSTIKYSANLGDGLEKTNDNKIKVKAADKSLEVTNEGVKVKAADNTLTTDDKGLKVNTGTINPVDSGDKAGTVTVNTNDAGKIATVDTVVNAVNNAAWNATAAKTNDGENGGTVKKQAVKAGDTVTFEADKNIKIAQDNGKFTFSTKDNVEFTTVKVGDTKNGKKPVELKNGDVINANNNPEQPTTALNVSSDGKPTQITGVGSVLNTTPVTTTPDGSTPAKQPNVVNLGTAHGQTALDNSVLNAAATVRDLANMGWKISSDNATGADGKDYSDVVRNADEVKFVGKNAAKVSGKTENGVRTITVDVEVPDVKTAELVSSKDGSVIAPSTDSKLQEALKAAKDELAALPKDATPEKKKEAENKVKAAETALSNAVDNKGVATAKNVADMINKSGFTLKTSEAEGGKKDTTSSGDEVINPGKAVEMVAGKNLTVKQEENGKVTYSLNPVLTGLTSAEFKGTDANAPTTKLTNSGVTITPTTTGKSPVSLTENGLNNGGNAITNVAGNLNGAENEAAKPDNADTIKNNAATVGDVLNAGWNLQGNGTAKDFVTAYDTVNFVDGDGTTVSVENTDNKTSKIKYSVNLGDGLEKTNDNKIKAKAGNGVTVDADGIKVNTGKGLKIDAADGNKVAVDTDDTTITVGNDGKVKAVTGSTEAVTDANKGTGEKAGQVRPVEADKGKLATVDAVAKAVNSAKWIAKATNTGADIEDADKTNDSATTGEGIAAGDEVTFTAGKNLRVKRDGKNFTFATDKDVSFDSVKVGAEDKTANGKKPVNLTTQAATTANNNEAGKEPTTALNISSGTDAKPTQLVGVGSVLNKETINTTPTGTVPAGNKPTTADLVDLKGTDAAPVNKNAAATVGDLANMGWKVSSDKTTGAEGAYLDVVKNANEVKFVGEGTAVVSGKTDGNVRTITVKVDDQVSTNNAVTPVVYTKADGTKVYPVKNAQGDIEYHTTPDGKGEGDQKVDDGDVITSVNGPEGTTKPTTLSNVAGNLNGAKKDTTAPTNEAAKPDNADTIKNNAATVGDVLNAGWNLQNNGTAKDFVKPFDTVNFVNGGNTTAVVTTKADGTTSDVTFNVTGLPIATTIATPNGPVQLTKVGDNYYPVKADGTPDIKTDTDGNPTNGYVKADNGNYYPAGDVTFTKDPATKVTTVTPKDGKQPVTFGNSLTNPNVVNTADAPNKAVAAPTTLNNVRGNLPTVNDADKKVTNADGTDKPNAGDVANINKAPLTAEEAADLLKPMKDGKANPKFAGNNAATVSDVLNAGWNLQNNSTAKDFVKPYDTVNFINGANTTAVVTTNAEGTASTVTYNVTGLPVTYTTADGTPVSRIGDKFYKVNDKGQPVDEQGNPSTKVNNNGEPIDDNGNVIKPVDTSKNPLSTNLVNPNVTNTATEPNKKTTSPTQLGNVTSGLQKYGDQVNGADLPGTNDKNRGLVDLSKPTTGEPKVSDNTAATVGDLRNMGWIVSADKTTGDLTKTYSDTVKNANEVKFVGEGTATVTGKTDDKGVRTITVKVDDQVSTNNAIMPTSFTTKDGKKVYPVKDDKGNVTYHTTPDGKGTPDNPDTVVNEGDVVTSVNGPKGTTTPTTLQNVKSNLPNVDDKKQKAFNPDGTEVTEPDSTTNTGNAKAPLSHTVVAAMVSPFMTNEEGNFIDENGNVTTDPKKYVRNPNFAANNAATVGDVLSAGWNLQNNGAAKDFVKPYDTVNFINGLGTTAVVTTREGNTTSDVTFNVKAANGSVTVDEDGVKVTTGEMKPAVDANNKETGAIATPADPTTAKQLKDTLDAAVKELATAKDALKTAETALAANPKDPALQKAVEDKKAEVAAKQTPVNEAQKAHDDAGLNKIATVQNVAEAINNAGFNLETSADGGEKLTTGTKNDGELIKPGNTVKMVAGNNLTVKQDENGKITYATKDNVTFTNVDTGTLNVGSPNTYTDGKGNTYTKVGDKYYNPADVVNGAPKQGATPVDVTTTPVTPVSPVTMKTEAAKLAKNNATDAQPSSALNITSKDGKPTQITGVGSTLNVKPVDTNPNGTLTTGDAHPNLVDLVGTKDAPVNKNAAATVGDLQNMGWVVSTKDGNGYTDVVKNANQVDFKGGTGISVKGETTKDGVREITISVKDGEVIKPNQFTAKVNGTDTPVTKVGDQYYNTADIDPKTGNPKANVTPVTPDKGTTPSNAGDGYVTGNKVAAAIQKSGFVVGKQKDALSAADFKDEDEKVNPDDELRFADGNNTKVKLATKESVDKDGNKVTTTTVKVDVTGLPVQYTDKNGTPVTKVGDKYFTVDDKGNPTATEVKPADLTTNMVNPAAAPNVIGAPTTLGNVKSNLPSVNDADKNAKDVAGNPIAGKDNKSAPITAKEAADIVNNAGNNAATVSDVLNAGWNLKNNDKARDFVKPYDTVDFIDGKGTKAVVETADNLTSTVKFDVDAGKITSNTNGSVTGPAGETLTKALKDAKDALAKLPKDADPATVKAAQDKVDAAQKAIDDSPNSNKVATAQNVADMINASGFTLKTSATADGKRDPASTGDEVINPGKAVEMIAGKNLTVTQDKNGKVTYATANDVNFNSLSLGTSQHAPTLSADEDGSLRLGSKGNQAPVRISNVAPGIKDGDAVNVSQLKGVTKDLEDKIDGVAAGSNAAASLPQVYLPGKSMVAASVGTYGSQGALAVGYSSISDNGKWLIKGQVNVNTKAKTGGGVGVGYLW